MSIETTDDEVIELENILVQFEKRMRQYRTTLAAMREDRDSARINHQMQRRNTEAFLCERDALANKIKGWQWAICESEILRDPTLKGRAREILSEIADGK